MAICNAINPASSFGKSTPVFFSIIFGLSVRLHRRSLLNEAVKHGGNLRAGCRTLWIKQIFGFSLYQSVADCPLHYHFCVIRNLVRVLKLVKIFRDGQLVALVVRVAVEDGGKLFAGNGIVRAEFVFAVACKDAILCCPCDCVGVPPSGFHIGKAIFVLRREAALHAPENGCHHAACHRPVRTEQGLARAGHQTIFVNEHRIVVEPVLFRNISKGVYDYVRIFIRAPACVYGHIFRQRNLGNLICQSAIYNWVISKAYAMALASLSLLY